MREQTIRIRLKKVVSFIHNSDGEDQRYGSICGADDAWDTADYVLWWIWKYEDSPLTDNPLADWDDQLVAEGLESIYQCTESDLTLYNFSLSDLFSGKKLTLAVNAEKVLVWAAIN